MFLINLISSATHSCFYEVNILNCVDSNIVSVIALNNFFCFLVKIDLDESFLILIIKSLPVGLKNNWGSCCLIKMLTQKFLLYGLHY